MKYLPTPLMSVVTSALNFDVDDCQVRGACELFTCKPVSADRKLPQEIFMAFALQRQLGALQSRSSEPSVNDVRDDSPFGPLTEKSSCRVYAFMISTLQTCHPHHDFTQVLRPNDDFRREELRSAMTVIDDILLQARAPSLGGSVPNHFDVFPDLTAPPPKTSKRKVGSSSGNGRYRVTKSRSDKNGSHKAKVSKTPQSPAAPSTIIEVADVFVDKYDKYEDNMCYPPLWSPLMWRRIDDEMVLTECQVYVYNVTHIPHADDHDNDQDPGRCGADTNPAILWSFRYLFYNARLKRVLYLHAQATPAYSLGSYGQRKCFSYHKTYSSSAEEDDDMADSPRNADEEFAGDYCDEDDRDWYENYGGMY